MQRIASSSPYARSVSFSAAVRAGDLVWTAGMTAAAPDGEIVGGTDAYAQAAEAWRKALAALAEAGAGPQDVVHTRTYVADREHWRDAGRAHEEAFGDAPPAATMVVCALLDPRMLVEVEAVARVTTA